MADELPAGFRVVTADAPSALPDGFRVVQPTGDFKPKGTLSPVKSGGIGDMLFDAADALGLPANRMREDASVIDAIMRGAADTASFGFADEIAAALGAATGIGGTFGDYSGNLDAQRTVDARDAAFNPGARLTGQLAGGAATGAGLARTGLSATANAARAGRGLPAITGASAAEGAGYGGAYGFGSGEGASDRLTQAGEGAAMGAAMGAVAPAAAEGVTRAARRAVTPFSASPERLAAANTLRNEGVDLSAGQITGSKALRYAEGEIGGNAARDLAERQGEQFTAAALRRAGVSADRATPAVIDQAFVDLGQRFDDLGRRNVLVPDAALSADMQAALNTYGSITPETFRAPIVQSVANDIQQAIQTRGNIGGDAYQVLRSKIEQAAQSARSDPQLSGALRDIRSALDDAMERSIAANNPADLGAWREARNEYRNLLTVTRAATGAGENAALGSISPSQLRNATMAREGRQNYARGRGDMADIARAGEAVMKPLPDSGTASRTAIRNLGIPAATGGAGALAAGLPGAVIGAVAPRVAGAAMMSRPGQAYLSNQMLPGGMGDESRALIDAILAVEAGAAAGNEGADDAMVDAIMRDRNAQRRRERDARR